MEGLQKLFKELEFRLTHLEKQIGFMIDHLNHLENLAQKHEWNIIELRDKETVK